MRLLPGAVHLPPSLRFPGCLAVCAGRDPGRRHEILAALVLPRLPALPPHRGLERLGVVRLDRREPGIATCWLAIASGRNFEMCEATATNFCSMYSKCNCSPIHFIADGTVFLRAELTADICSTGM